jgi:hypothetical protein
MRRAVRESLRWLPLLFWITGIHAQTCLVLSRPVLNSSGTATFNLSLHSVAGGAPAALQWAFQYSSSSIAALTVDDGPTLARAGKTTFCAGGASSFDCLAVGVNANMIGDGIIAKVTAALVPGADSANLAIKSSLGASREGYFIAVVAKSSAQAYSNCGPEPRRRGEVGKMMFSVF